MTNRTDEEEISIPSDALMEVLSWLPAKSLMLFNSVSKHWFSLISHPVFAKMHRTRSYVREGGVNLIVKFPFTYPTPPNILDRCFLMIDWPRKDPMNQASVHEPYVPFTTNSMSNIVHGLICFYHQEDPEGYIFVYNFTTRENLPLRPPPRDQNHTSNKRSCYLGFDPVNNVYKVLHFWWHEDSLHQDQCEVFTLGHKRWRRINILSGITPIKHWSDSFSDDDNGFLYWISYDMYTKEKSIITFDVEHEQFDLIDYPRERKPVEGTTYLTQLGRHFSLVAFPQHLPLRETKVFTI